MLFSGLKMFASTPTGPYYEYNKDIIDHLISKYGDRFQIYGLDTVKLGINLASFSMPDFADVITDVNKLLPLLDKNCFLVIDIKDMKLLVFNKTMLTPMVRSPEFLKIVTDHYTFDDNINDEIKDVIKCAIMNITCNKLAEIMNKTISDLDDSVKVTVHYTCIGTDDLETIEQRVDNMLHTGRVDRVYNLDDEQERLIYGIINSKGEQLHIGKVYQGNGKWQYNVVE